MARLSSLHGPFSALTAEDREALVRAGRWREYTAGEQLVRQGSNDRFVHVLATGRVKVVRATSDGQELFLALHGSGDVLGELAAIDGGARSGSVVAFDRVVALQVPGDAFVTYLRERPEVMLEVLRTVAGRLRATDNRLVDLASETTETRLARQLLRLLAQHGDPSEDGMVLGLSLTQADLASLIGASREGVSHALGRLRRAGAVQTGRRRLVITDVELLRSAAGI